MLEFAGFMAGLICLASYVPYVHDIYVHKVRPERAAWFIWLVLAAVTISTQVASGAGASLWLSLFDTGAICLIFILSFRYGMGGFTRRDVRALAVAGIGLLLWIFTNQPLLALLCALMVDSSAFVLIIVKSYKEPYTETYTMWVVVAVSSAMTLLAAGQFDVALWLYPLYLGLSHLAVVMAIFMGRRRHAAVAPLPILLTVNEPVETAKATAA